jgi:hypothetical protein
MVVALMGGMFRQEIVPKHLLAEPRHVILIGKVCFVTCVPVKLTFTAFFAVISVDMIISSVWLISMLQCGKRAFADGAE